MKKILIFLILVLLTMSYSCGPQVTDNPGDDKDQYVNLPDLTDLSRTEINAKMEELEIKYFYKFSSMICSSDETRDKFVNYGSGYQAGDLVKKDYGIYIYTTVLPLKISYPAQCTLDVDYQNKSFIDDGIGIVELQYAIDGDTARFYDRHSKTITDSFSVRFLGLDTPESTYTKEPWGKSASSYTANILNNAQEIVLEAEGARTETYGRYLAFVWADGKLVNLMIAQEAYSTSNLSSSSKYYQLMYEAMLTAKQTGRRFYGEIDPSYTYKK